MTTQTIRLLTSAALLAGGSMSLWRQQSDKIPSLPPKSPTAQEMANDAAKAPKSNLGQKLEQLGSQAADEKTAGEVRDTLAEIINDAVAEGKFSDLLGHLAAADRQRIGDLRGEKFEAFNQTLAQFRADFQQKYHEEFNFKPDYLKNADINLGANKDSLSVSLSNLEKTPAVNPSPAGDLPSPLNPEGSIGKDIPSKTGLSVVGGPTLVMINESQPIHAWKLDIPNEITGRQLRDTLKSHLQKLDDQKSTWSEDKVAIYRAIATQVFQATQDSSLATDQ